MLTKLSFLTVKVSYLPSGNKLSSIRASQCIVNLDARDRMISSLTAVMASATVAFGNMNILDDTTPLKCILPSHSMYSTDSGREFSYE